MIQCYEVVDDSMTLGANWYIDIENTLYISGFENGYYESLV